MSNIQKNIRKIRAVKGWSQAKFAEAFELTRGAVGAYEEGRAEPKLDTIVMIANKIGISLDSFVNTELTVNQVHCFDADKSLSVETPNQSIIPVVNQDVLLGSDIDHLTEKLHSASNKIWVPKEWRKTKLVLEFYGRLRMDSPAETNWLFLQELSKQEQTAPRKMLSLIVNDEVHVGYWSNDSELLFHTSQGLDFNDESIRLKFKVTGVLKGTENFYFH